jgi:hypothetical protein
MAAMMTSSTALAAASSTVHGLRLPRARAPATAAPSRRGLVCRAAADFAPQKMSKPVRDAQRMGLDLSEGVFGFTPFAELWTGRLAMAGFAVGVAEEMLTGQGILEQIGVTNGAPSDVLTAALLVLMCTPTAVLSAKTLVDAQTGQMTVRQFKRWANLLGLRNDEDAEVVAYMKKADGLAAALRLRDEKAAGVRQELPLSQAPSCAWPRENAPDFCPVDFRSEREMEAEASMAYAREVEINNGRAAMVGFAAAVCAEAASGGGVFQQLIWAFKAMGLLGAASGF